MDSCNEFFTQHKLEFGHLSPLRASGYLACSDVIYAGGFLNPPMHDLMLFVRKQEQMGMICKRQLFKWIRILGLKCFSTCL